MLSRQQFIVRAEFNFAQSTRVQPLVVGRRNRTVDKRKEQELRSIVHGVCGFSAKQLQAVSHMLSEEHLKQIRVAMNIPPTNQGRRRQEGLVAKQLRSDLDEAGLARLKQAVMLAQRSNQPFNDSNVEQQLDEWTQGLLQNKQDIVDELYQLLQEQGLDWQQLRTWVRQVQQHQQEQEQQQQQQDQQRQQQSLEQGFGLSSSSAGSEDEAMLQVEPEVQQLIMELSSPQQQQRKKKGKQGSSSSPVSAARRGIRRMLKPLAVARFAAVGGGQ